MPTSRALIRDKLRPTIGYDILDRGSRGCGREAEGGGLLTQRLPFHRVTRQPASYRQVSVRSVPIPAPITSLLLRACKPLWRIVRCQQERVASDGLGYSCRHN